MPPKLKGNPHGRNSTYTNKACRCPYCTFAHRTYEQKANRRRGRFTRQRVQRDPMALIVREDLSELTLREMSEHGLVIGRCALCFVVFIREEGATRCRMKERCKARQRKTAGEAYGPLERRGVGKLASAPA